MNGVDHQVFDVPLTIMTRKDALIKQGNNDKTIDKLYKEAMDRRRRVKVSSTTIRNGQPMRVIHL